MATTDTPLSVRQKMKDFLTELTPQVLVIAAVAYLCRSIVAHCLSKDVERFKDQLRSQQEAHLRETQHSLDLAKLEHQIRFARLYEKRFSKIEELHSDTRELIDALLESLRVEASTRSSRIVDTMKKVSSLHRKLRLFEIFLPAAFVDEWDQELSSVSLALSKLGAATADPMRVDLPQLREAVDKVAASLRRMNGQLISKARDLLEQRS